MKKLIQGHQRFRESYVPKHIDQLEELSHGQKPRVLFITCSDSRIDPNLITQADIGDLFIIRNAGNIIPPYGAANGGEGAAVEYALNALDIQQIIVCGHSHCGAMKGLLQLGKLEEEMPLVYDWLKHSEATRRLVRENYTQYSGEELLEITIAENVLTQIENLKTYPIVHSRLYQRRLEIFAWIYHLETAEVLAFDPDTHSYVPPQSQLSIRELGGLVPGEYEKTSAPPVACELVNRSPIAETGAQRSLEPMSQTVHAETVLEPMPWLTPEQAERIYRGSVAQR
ncbi:carbonate dehydratase [Leptolyngbya sp. NIES-3755]|nr:carbonate dehydratase [Leptolyngbya sp. NIES-3755]